MEMGNGLRFLVCSLLVPLIYCDELANRDKRFSIFQIIKFENAPCVGSSSRNGTCFTTAECENAGGTEGGSCADGFGVCCTLIIEEGGATSLNQSYIVQDSSSSLTAGGKTYTVCPCSSSVCRIRFDLSTFTLAAPVTSPGVTAAAAASGIATGDCVTDQFSITSAGHQGSPIICGTNTGQHMILDTNGSSCVKVNFGIGAASTTREWDIMVTQYSCGEEAGGPPGCLQWHMTGTGVVRSFNFPDQTAGTAVKDVVTHLSNQHYSICIRKPADRSRVCYYPCTVKAIAAADESTSFGLSVSPDAAAQSAVDTACIGDYLEIIGATTLAISAIDAVSADTHRLCGRIFSNAAAATAAISVCTMSAPFRIGVHFDADELIGFTDDDATTDELEIRPGGQLGFSLCYATPA